MNEQGAVWFTVGAIGAMTLVIAAIVNVNGATYLCGVAFGVALGTVATKKKAPEVSPEG
jgi:hypothetical protein